AASMRMASVIFPSASGTLKSTRMNTRLPFRARSEMDSLCILLMAAPFLEAARCRACASRRACVRSRSRLQNELDNIAQPAAETPLVVVPGEYLHHAVAESIRQRPIHNRGV